MTASEPTVRRTGRIVALYVGAIAVVPTVSVLAAILVVPDVRTGVRSAAGFLQLAGVALIGWGFAANRVRFGGRAPLMESFVKPMKRHLGLAPSADDEVEDERVSQAVAKPDAKVRVRAGEESTLEHRVAILEQRVEQIDDAMDRVAAEAREERRELREGLRAESAVRRKAIRHVENRLAEAATEGMGREVVGFIWLGIGIVAETLVAVW